MPSRPLAVRRLYDSGRFDLTIADQLLGSFEGAGRAARDVLQRRSLAYVQPNPTTRSSILAHHIPRASDGSFPCHILPVGAKTSLSLALQTATASGHQIVLLTPAYSGLVGIADSLGPSCHVKFRGPYGLGEPDWDSLEAAMRRRKSVVVLLNPENPTGKVWCEDDLRRIDEIAYHYDGMVISDEVHRDLVWTGGATSFAASMRASRWIAIGSLAKSFNIGSIPFSWMIEGSLTVHQEVADVLRKIGLYQSSLIGEAVAAACLSDDGMYWLARRRRYLADLIDLSLSRLSAAFDVEPPQAGFLLWVRSRNRDEDLGRRLLEGGVKTISGLRYGAPADAVRINVAMRRAGLDMALTRIIRAA